MRTLAELKNSTALHSRSNRSQCKFCFQLHLFALILFTVFIPYSAQAKMRSQVVASLCPSDLLELTVINPSQEDIAFWIYTDFDHASHEESFEVSAQSKIKLNGIEINNQNHAFLVKTVNDKIQIQATCQGKSWTPNVLTSPRKKVPSSVRTNYYVTNLNHEVQHLDFLFKDINGQILEIQKVLTDDHLETTTYKMTPPAHTHFVEVIGEGRWTLQYENPLEEIILSAEDLKKEMNPKAEGSYFLVSQASGHESFIIHLTDAVQILRAREIIQKKLAKMVVGIIGPNAQEHNRNFSEKVKTPWSWNIQKVLNFSDFASIDCNQSPSQIEESRDAILSSEREGLICFWGFFPVRELKIDDLK